MKVSYLELDKEHQEIKDELLQAIKPVLETAQFINGEETRRFEENVKRLLRVQYVVGVNSGTDALFLGMKALGIGPGDEIIVPANSFLASATSVVMTGAKPVFADVKDNLLIDESQLQNLITDRTKAIMPVHLTGKPCNMEAIATIAKKHQLFIIEDCAQAILAKYNNKLVGTTGDVGCFSLHPLKNLAACGDAGFICTDSKELFEKLLPLRNICLKNRDEADVIGYNSRLDSIQAAILNTKLKYLEKTTKKRRTNAKTYSDFFEKKKIDKIIYFPRDEEKEYGVYHTYVIQAEQRDELQKYLLKKGIETKIHYPIPIHKQNCFKGDSSQVPNVEKQAQTILSLPIHQHLSLDQIQYVCEQIQKFYS